MGFGVRVCVEGDGWGCGVVGFGLWSEGFGVVSEGCVGFGVVRVVSEGVWGSDQPVCGATGVRCMVVRFGKAWGFDHGQGWVGSGSLLLGAGVSEHRVR